ncbi:MAG: zinc ribbon domain-containing protein YjdM [Gammaproteobacteria bacterium]
MNLQKCPKCNSNNIYFDGSLWICPECFYECDNLDVADNSDTQIIKDAYGTKLSDGDSVTLIKELKVKGSSSTIKIGTKVKNIKLGEFGAGHDISCKIEGFGAMNLKSEFVKKA